MATLVNRYIDTASLATATAVWMDSAFSAKAPDGWYQSCGIVREQSGGFLLPSRSCAYPCSVPCGTPATFNYNYFGIYDVQVTLGAGLGAVEVGFLIDSIPNALFVSYNGTTYSELSCINYGYVNKYFGANASFVTYGFPAGSPYLLPNFEWDGGASNNWSPTGGSETIAIAGADTTSLAGVPGNAKLFIPKVDINPQIMDIRVIGPVGGSANSWLVTNACPGLLTGFGVSNVAVSSVAACALPWSNTFYNGPVNGSAGLPALYDWMFADDKAENKLGSYPGFGPGYYSYDDGTGIAKWFQLDANSIIINLGVC